MIEIVVVGFGEDDFEIEIKDGLLIIVGCKILLEEGEVECEFLYCGIVECGFLCWF